MNNFYPRSPCGERRLRAYQRYFAADISIHALLAESDSIPPAAACGANTFLSTLSLRRATRFAGAAPAPNKFLSTLSLRRATRRLWLLAQTAPFLSTLSLRRATEQAIKAEQTARISIHALLAESDLAPQVVGVVLVKFLSTLSLRRATPRPCPSRGRNRNFYPRSPCGERQYVHTRILQSPDFYPRSPCGERHGNYLLSSKG